MHASPRSCTAFPALRALQATCHPPYPRACRDLHPRGPPAFRSSPRCPVATETRTATAAMEGSIPADRLRFRRRPCRVSLLSLRYGNMHCCNMRHRDEFLVFSFRCDFRYGNMHFRDELLVFGAMCPPMHILFGMCRLAELRFFSRKCRVFSLFFRFVWFVGICFFCIVFLDVTLDSTAVGACCPNVVFFRGNSERKAC